jgi:DNA-binding NtrC family response regulator
LNGLSISATMPPNSQDAARDAISSQRHPSDGARPASDQPPGRAARARAACQPLDGDPARPVVETFVTLLLAESMKEIVRTAARVASTRIPILVTGESGTGKEVLARYIHQQSYRAPKPFVAFNCATVPRDLIESQLFGHRRGAFTGAYENFSGLIRAADGGTLFLDEIGDLDREVQPKLLRFLESGEVHPFGQPHPVTVKVRVIAATNADVDRLMRDGSFRQDLFYRLSGIRYHIPPLRERREEIPALVRQFTNAALSEFGKADVRLAEETLQCLTLFTWPGNVRQLANEVRRAVALAEDGQLVRPEHLSPEIPAACGGVIAQFSVLARDAVTLSLNQPLASALESLERSMVSHALDAAKGKVESAAKLLGVSRKGLYLKRHRLGL